MKRSIAFVSVVPSPYQRDIFAALSRRNDLSVQIYYLEDGAPDSPWPKCELHDYETILPGLWFGKGPVRFHCNFLPTDLDRFDLVVMNTIVSLTAQRLIRGHLRRKPWMFWGERLRRQHSAAARFLQRQLTHPLASAVGIAAIGSLAVEQYRKAFPHQRIFNIPYHTNLRPFQSVAKNRAAAFTFLFCGQMIARKGLDVLLAAFSQVVKSGADTRLLLVGREAELPRLLPQLDPDVRSRIDYAGFQSPDRLPHFFARANVLVLPSRHDGWGVVVNQALGAGLPLLCSDTVGAAHDLLAPEVNGRRFPAGDGQALADAMLELAAHPERAEQWGAASAEMAQAWTPEAGAAKWSDAIDSILRE